MANAGAIVLQDLFARFGQRQLAGPVLILAILAMMVLPLPPFVLDLFFTFNIAISVIVMLVAMSVMKPLDFSVFPTVLLVTTLLRLSLNVASTRIVLLDGHTGQQFCCAGPAGLGDGVGAGAYADFLHRAFIGRVG